MPFVSTDTAILNNSTNAYNFTIPENSVAGTVIGRVAFDGDGDGDGDGDPVAYHLAGDDAYNFVINRDTGEITVADDAVLDYEALETGIIEVNVGAVTRQAGQPVQKSEMIVRVAVGNVAEANTRDTFDLTAIHSEISQQDLPGLLAGANRIDGFEAGVDTLDFADGVTEIWTRIVADGAADGGQSRLITAFNAATSAVVHHALLTGYTGTITAAHLGAAITVKTSIIGTDRSDRYSGALHGTEWSDRYSRALHGTDGDDHIDGGAGNDRLYGGAGDDTLNGGAENDWLYGGAGDDTLIGGVGYDHLYGGAGDDTLNGGAGGDQLHGGAGDDTLNSGAGDDSLYGGAGADIFDVSDSHSAGSYYHHADNIMDFTQGADRIHITGVSDIWYRAIDTNSDSTSDSTPDSIILYDAANNGNIYAVLRDFTGDLSAADFSGDNGIGTINVTAIDDSQGLTITGRNQSSGQEFLYGSAGNDTIDGRAGDDYLDGGAGADRLTGGTGADGFSVNDLAETLDRADHITDFHDHTSASGERDTIGTSYRTSHVWIQRRDVDEDGNMDTVLYDGTSTAQGSGIYAILEDYSGDLNTDDFRKPSLTLHEANIFDLTVIHSEISQHDLPGLLAGANRANRVDGFEAGLGSLNFADGVTEIWTRIVADGAAAGGQSRLITAFNAATGAVVHHALLTGYTGAITAAHLGAAITVKTSIIGTEWSDRGSKALRGTDGDDHIDGGAGNDHLYGGAGDDTLIGGAGRDELHGGAGADIFDVSDSHRAGRSYRTDKIMDFTQGVDRIHIAGVSDIWYRAIDRNNDSTPDSIILYDAADNGNIYAFLRNFTGDLSAADFSGDNGIGTINVTAIDDSQGLTITGRDQSSGWEVIYGSAGNDTIDGRAGNDKLYGGAGADRLTGGTGRDRFYVNDLAETLDRADHITDFHDHTSARGERDHIYIGSSISDVWIQRRDVDEDGNMDTVLYDGTSTARGSGIYAILEDYSGDLDADDFYLSNPTLHEANIFDLTAIHTEISQQDLPGLLAGANRIDGFEAGGDTLDFADGVTEIWTRIVADGAAAGGQSRLITAFNVATGAMVHHALLTGYTGAITAAHLGAAITVKTSIIGTDGSDWGSKALRGTDGDDHIDGGAGRDWLHGGAGDDTLIGGAGRDELHGGAGADIFDVSDNHGAGRHYQYVDKIMDFTQGADRIRIAGVSDIWYRAIDTNKNSTPDSIIFYDAADNGNIYAVLRGFTGDLSAADFSGDNGIGTINVTAIDDSQGLTITGKNQSSGQEFLYGSAGNDTIDGRAGDDVLYGGAGDDTLNGGAGHDELRGGAGDDTLNGGAGNDWLIGGAGADRLTGGTGADRFLVNDRAETLDRADHITDFHDHTSASDERDTIYIDYFTPHVWIQRRDVDEDGNMDTVLYDGTSTARGSSIYAILDNYSGDLDADDFYAFNLTLHDVV